MKQEDITYYLYSTEAVPEDTIKKIISICEAVDFCGTIKPPFYNGLEGFEKDVKQEFEITPDAAMELSEDHVHSNIEFLEWQNDELLLGLAEDLEDISGKRSAVIDSIALLSGPHEILSLEDNVIIKSEFSFAFHSEVTFSEDDAAEFNFTAKKDKAFQEKLGMLNSICNADLKGFIGGS